VGTSGDSATQWLQELKRGNREAARELWQRYARRMNDVARARLRTAKHGGFDEEDVTLSAFDNFCRAVQTGRYEDLEGSDGLWQLLATFTLRKANDRLKGEAAEKRGGPELLSDQPRTFRGGADSRLEKIPTRELGPESAALMAEECSRLFSLLDDPELESLVLLKLEGHTNDEIAERLGYTRRTIQRMLNIVRNHWKDERAASRLDG
jgi:DNA-directed RNA polymerase specialized sigma24 family protein